MNLRDITSSPTTDGSSPETVVDDLPDGLEVDTVRIGELLSTNKSLLDVESLSLRQSLRTALCIVGDLETNISNARNALAGLERTKSRIQLHMVDLQTILHPVRALPDDILYIIFQWSISLALKGRTGNLEIGNSLDPLAAPWTVSQVCSRWRHVALSHPRLWSTIDIPLIEYNDKIPLRCLMYRLILLFKRSGTCDLSLRIVENGGWDDIIPVLQAETGRWRELWTGSSSAFIQGLSGSSFGRLRQLKMDLVPIAGSAAIDTFRFADSLTIYEQHRGSNVDVHLPWHQIKSYTSRRCSLRYLPSMAALETLDIWDVHGANMARQTLSSTSPETPETLPSLRIFKILEDDSRGDPGLVKYIFDRIRVPQVATLQIGFLNCLEARLPCLHQGTSNLVNLSLNSHQAALPIPELLAFLHTTRNVRSLHVGGSAAPMELLDALYFGQDMRSPLLLPHLTSLRLRASTMAGKFCDAVFRAVKSRTREAPIGEDSSLKAHIAELQIIKDFSVARAALWTSYRRENAAKQSWQAMASVVPILFVEKNKF